jgi:GGDEF domain-containing protein
MRGWCREAPPGKKRFMLLLQIDLDDFKRVNDTHGHEGGDKLLEDVADGIRSNTDVIGSRPGGDEFNVAFVTEVDDSEVPEGVSDEEMRELLEALPEGHRDNAGIIAARRAQGFARRLESLLDRVMSSSASAMWLKAGLSAADRVRPEPGASIGFAVGGSWERKDDTKRRADGAMYVRKRERKLVKALAKNAAARQELEELGVMELLGWMIEALGVVTDPINQALLRTLEEIRGDREPSTETR